MAPAVASVSTVFPMRHVGSVKRDGGHVARYAGVSTVQRAATCPFHALHNNTRKAILDGGICYPPNCPPRQMLAWCCLSLAVQQAGMCIDRCALNCALLIRGTRLSVWRVERSFDSGVGRGKQA